MTICAPSSGICRPSPRPGGPGCGTQGSWPGSWRRPPRAWPPPGPGRPPHHRTGRRPEGRGTGQGLGEGRHPEDPVHRRHPGAGRAPAAEGAVARPGEGGGERGSRPWNARTRSCGRARREAQKQFDELKAVFLAEHENQVVAQGPPGGPRPGAGGGPAGAPAGQVRRLLQQRQGRAVVRVDNGACGGCRTRLRIPFVAQLREGPRLFCESCQRILYDPAKA